MVMHSFDRMMALGWSIAWKSPLMVRLLPVASVPWRTRLGGLGKSDYQILEHMEVPIVMVGLTARRQASCWI